MLTFLIENMSTDAKYQRLAFRIFADFSGTIAVPAVLAALLGKWLDQKYDSAPWFMIGLLIIAFGLTAIFIVKKAKFYRKAYERLNKESEEIKN